MAPQPIKAVGSRAEVWHGTADHTSGGLRRSDLYQDKYGNIKSKLKRELALRQNHLKGHLLPKGSHAFVPGGRRARP